MIRLSLIVNELTSRAVEGGGSTQAFTFDSGTRGINKKKLKIVLGGHNSVLFFLNPFTASSDQIRGNHFYFSPTTNSKQMIILRLKLNKLY